MLLGRLLADVVDAEVVVGVELLVWVGEVSPRQLLMGLDDQLLGGGGGGGGGISIDGGGE